MLLCRAEATRDGNVDRIGRDILDGFRALGWAAEDIVLAPRDAARTMAATMARIERGEFALVLSVQDMGHFGGAEIGAILKRGGARRVYWALDHPFSGWNSVASLAADSVVTYPSRANLDCCRQILRRDVRLLTLAHAAAPCDAVPWRDRTIEALFVGNAPPESPDALRAAWPQRYPQPWASLLEAMAARFDPAASDSLDGLAVAAIASQDIDPATVERGNFMLLLAAFDAYAWACMRIAYVQALKDVPLTLIGRSWEGLAGGRARIMGALPTGQARAAMAEAKLVLNILPGWYRSHERVFEGMAAGAAVATTGQGTIANAVGVDHDPADARALAYLGPLNGAGDRLGALLADAARLEALAEAGRAEQRARHGWAHRVAALLDFLGQPD